MINKVQEFLNDNFGEVRCFEKDNVVWFVATDVSKILKYRDAHDLTKGLDDDEMGTQTLRTHGGEQECLIINESGLYNAILSITKRNTERYKIARDFKKWITGVVIPTIRKDDAYISGEENVDMNNEEQEDEFVLKAMNILQKKVDRLKKENAEMKPKVKKWDKFLDSNGCYSFTEVSKLISTMAQDEKSDISISVVKLTDFLRNKGVLNKSKSPDIVKMAKLKREVIKIYPTNHMKIISM